mmetsp:Transcript_10835/g.32910  ORF Transcript_10835/g.32910 Transcript_10835/m.32910 type:complete len:296 (-) Transcript_10835:637-1524(-)|eukprot:CAMPEP_0118874140 /NCGR_PEP_ID=MMETSP1163-20130328/15689_1 /TAXON_ID=124430 /ORGANISM="Phaeomonas parva, Strain CCMP2877" /LENGTH=295 /DNA_ID=CAMNT_0006809495 /DNA_START=382 /DNA_END=1269 /DNA_ORIENTATION=+
MAPKNNDYMMLPQTQACVRMHHYRTIGRIGFKALAFMSVVAAMTLGVMHLHTSNTLVMVGATTDAEPQLVMESATVERPKRERRQLHEVAEPAVREQEKGKIMFEEQALHGDAAPADAVEDANMQTVLTDMRTKEDQRHLEELALQAQETLQAQEATYGQPFEVIFVNKASFAADLFFDDGRFGAFVGTFQPGDVMSMNSFVGHRFLWTSSGVRDQLVAGLGEGVPMEPLITGADREVVLPPDTRPRQETCMDLYKICHDEAIRGGCDANPDWMLRNCCSSCREANLAKQKREQL